MNEPTQDNDLTADQVARLLHIGLGSDEPQTVADACERRTELLYELLSRPLPADGSVVNFLPEVLRPLSRKLTSVAGEVLKDLLLNGQTDLATLQRIKDFARQLARGHEGRVLCDIALTLYCAAIAAALVHHNERITSKGDADLAKSFGTLAGQTWIGEDLSRLFTEAGARCGEKVMPPQGETGDEGPVTR